MLGGSAPSPTSGAPYRTESSNRTTWPSPAHQSDICNRGYGVYSLFPEPGNTPRTLFAPASKTSHHNNYPDFAGMQKVSETFFSSKFTFVSSRTPQFDSSSHFGSEPEVTQASQLNFAQVSKPYSLPGKKTDEQDVRKEARSKRMSNDVIIIKTEAEEMNKVQEKNKSVMQNKLEEEGSEKNKKNGIPIVESESVTARSEILANEPDSTEFKISDEVQAGEDVTNSEMVISEKESVTSGNGIGYSCGSDSVKCHHNNKIIGNGISKEKCNIRVINSVNETCGKKLKKIDKFSVKVESMSDSCSKFTENKYINPKTSDSNGKNLSASSKKFSNESFKPSPTRTLSLSPQNGGCSRTTPVTFKNTTHQDPDPKIQNIHVEVPPLFIKKEPSDFHKNSNGTPFLSPSHLEANYFNPSGLNLLDGQLLSPVPYGSSFESSSRQKDNFLSPLDQNFLGPTPAFLSPRPMPESPFLSPDLELSRFGGYKNYSLLPKIGGNYLMSGNSGRVSDEVFLRSPGCMPPKEDRIPEGTGLFINSNVTSKEPRNKISENNSCGGPNVTPCQVAEVTSASSLLSPKHSSVNPLVVKQETVSTASSSSSAAAGLVEQTKESAFITSGQSTIVSSTVGTASLRQRCQQQLNEIKIPSNNVPSPPVMHRSVQSPASIDLSSTLGASVFAGGIMGERSANLITTWPAQTHNPTLWQYSAPIDYPPFPPVGLQLVRDPITGHFLLIPASNLEALQRAILWPNYQTTPPQMIIPPLSVQPSTPHLLVDTNVPAVDYLTSETIHHSAHQHRILIASDDTSKRKITAPAVVKMENSDCSSTIVVTTCDSNNIYSKNELGTLSPRRESIFQRTSVSLETGRRSQATSPCLNPILEGLSQPPDLREAATDSSLLQKMTTVTLQDASNQTDMPFETESKDCISSIVCKDKFAPYIKTKITEQNLNVAKTQDVGTETAFNSGLQDNKQAVLREIRQKKEVRESLNIQCCNVPETLNIKKEIVSPLQVDISGLELLSNSIEQFVCVAKCKKVEMESREMDGLRNSVIVDERKDLSNDACEGAVLLQNLRNGFREVEEDETYESKTSKNFGGLGLLCALAEQRFQEEIGMEIIDKENAEEEQKDEITKEEQMKDILVNDSIFHQRKDDEENDSVVDYRSDNDELPKLKREVEILDFEDDENISDDGKKAVHCDGDCKHSEVDSSSSRSSCEKISKRGPGRPKKFKRDNLLPKPLFRKSQRNYKEMSPPILEKETDFPYIGKTDLLENSVLTNSKEDILRPPTLTPNDVLDPVIKTTPGTPESTHSEISPAAVKVSSDKLMKKKEETSECESKKRKSSDGDFFSSSKKRKVGRPKKHHLLSENSITETIVAKKPKTKPSYLFQPVQTVENWNSLKTKTEDVLFDNNDKNNTLVKLYANPAGAELPAKEEEKKSKKIRPKLKAEAKMKEWTAARDDESRFSSESKKSANKDENCFSSDSKKSTSKDENCFSSESKKSASKGENCFSAESKKSSSKGENCFSAESKKSASKDENCKQKVKIQKKIAIDVKKSIGSSRINGTKEPVLPSCVLTTEHLKSDKFPMRTLTAMGGLFYAGQLSAIRPPDVYGITVDGERGNRPHIYSREEILKDSILEVKPEKTSYLTPGTRCCAYWSEQYRCLYPGTVSVPVSPDPDLDDKFVNVEFDDGDSGKINIDDIRLLPEDYPIVEYDPNPLQSLSKRKRRISGASVESHSKERKSVDSSTNSEKNETVSNKISNKTETNEETERKTLSHGYEPGSFLSLESERRHLKKKRREKLKRLQSLSLDKKKKHKKHRCSDEHRHHRHHKKHRKHRHKHGKRHNNELDGEIKRENEKAEEASNTDKEEQPLESKSKCKSTEKSKNVKPKKCKERTESVESRSKMAAFLPARQLWGWSGKGFRRPGAKGRAKKEFYKTIQRGKERITVGDCAVFLSTGRPDRPYIGRIESMWESWGTNMIVRVKWFYHPEETVGCPATLEYPGALFESPHVDENDVQTISHKCEVLPLKEYTSKIGDDPQRYETIYDNNDIYYLAGYYDPTNTTLKMEPGVK